MDREFPEFFKTHLTFISRLFFKASRSLGTKVQVLLSGAVVDPKTGRKFPFGQKHYLIGLTMRHEDGQQKGKKSRSADWIIIYRVSVNGFGLQPSTPYTI